MKKVMLLTLLLAGTLLQAQTVIQPIANGDYWQIDGYQRRLPELANRTTFPRTISFPNGAVAVNNISVNRIIGANELRWSLAGVQDLTDVAIEYSRDLRRFERAGLVQLHRVESETDYVFRHTFADRNLVYYRLALLRNGQTIAFTPAVQVLEEEERTKVFPTVVNGSTLYVKTGQPYERLQVVNSASKPVYEKGLGNQTGTITIGLPSLPTGVYFVRLVGNNAPQHVQRILVQ